MYGWGIAGGLMRKLTAWLLPTAIVLAGCAGHKEPAQTPSPNAGQPVGGTESTQSASAASDPKDADMAASVRKALGVDAGLVLIEVRQGVVTLHGTIDTKLHQDAIVKKAKGVPGVVSVDDKTKVVSL
jgi:PBP1b-binding outer membrane lipoprotein LpoB